MSEREGASEARPRGFLVKRRYPFLYSYILHIDSKFPVKLDFPWLQNITSDNVFHSPAHYVRFDTLEQFQAQKVNGSGSSGTTQTEADMEESTRE